MNSLQSDYQLAARFAAEHHAEQTMKGSKANYMLHLSCVAMEVMVAYQHDSDFELSLAVQMALLHDVLEDTQATEAAIKSEFGGAVLEGVLALTKRAVIKDKDKAMLDSLARLKQTAKEARLVKIADRITNLQSPPSHWSKSKIKAYHQQALVIYQTLKGENDYLDQRLAYCIQRYQKHLN